MKFQYYDPISLIPALRERGIRSGAYRVCQGCIFTEVPPEDSIHDQDNFFENSVQSDCFCEHCSITVEDSREPFHLSEDSTLNQKVAELERIIEMI